MMKDFLNRSVRFYLMHFPITEGKRQLLRLTKDMISPEEPLVIFKTKYDFFLKINLNNPEHQQMYFYGEHDERYEIKHLRKIIKEGDICWDIGANIGFYTCLFASLVGEKGMVVSFEPSSKCMEFLKDNVSMNRFENVVMIKKAIGDSKEDKKLFYNSKDLAEGTASLKHSDKKREFEIVEVEAIDNLFAALPGPDFIKIDVEGYQMELFQGAKKFFRNHTPIVMIEVEHDSNAREISNYIRNLGYDRIYEFRKYGVFECEDIVHSKARNFLLIKEAHPHFSRIQNFIL
jgi:FkbM family methyltransferase